ncbi:MAG: DUF2029 domain-containing protein [Flavobacteriales bacterium]|nr:DUF2029 domain-containing protein [Flavobacteriales bacterium]
MSTKDRWIAWGGFMMLLLGVAFLGYGPHRSESALLLGGFAVAFLGYLLLHARIGGMSPRAFFVLVIALRVLLLFAPITWTDDHFRYWWDGVCTVNGLSPFAHPPRDLLSLHPGLFSADHLAMLNSPGFHSAYPPLAQAAFALAAWLGGAYPDAWMLFMRLIIVLCEAVSIALLMRLLRRERAGLTAVALYAFNPLVLIELTVNLHTEALMIPLCLGAVLMLRSDRLWAVGLLIGLAASARLMPIVFILALPAVVGIKRSVLPAAIAGCAFASSWLPFWTPELIPNFLSSLKLFGTYLEYNGGLFELLRRALGDDAVKGTGLIGAITLCALIAYAIIRFRKGAMELGEAMLWLLAMVLFGSQAVHPWYITPLIAFAALTRWRWPLWWSLLIMPTYLTYGSEPFAQPYWWITMEYGALVVLIGIEWLGRASTWPESVGSISMYDLR